MSNVESILPKLLLFDERENIAKDVTGVKQGVGERVQRWVTTVKHWMTTAPLPKVWCVPVSQMSQTKWNK